MDLYKCICTSGRTGVDSHLCVRLCLCYLLVNERKLQVNTLETIHTVLHPTFQLAVRDDIIRNNPSHGVMSEIKKKPGRNHGVRHALTVEQQRAFMNRF